ncbi:hypothetical protein JMJ58_03735 [Haloterrigena salifodinae]|uniref:Uncharacterized protein n=1 Tax=Haloterrigena salifodinae TaxID=2675099 RepID=A0A8T8E3G7_9EURY|nr:hypothetical protein [Haloterrigena salifodinae]QRV16020.1 hypothetical protein JMJ58_03735 [Haloterrigena salifodinae]
MNLLTPLQSLSVDLSLTNVLQIALSALLAGLYYLMYRAQKKQTEIQETQSQIMEWQTQLMAAEHQPELVTEGKIDAEENTVSVTLSNIGEGRARELGIVCYTFYKDKRGYWMPFSMEVLDFVIGPVKTPLNRITRTTKVDVAGESMPVNIGSHPDPSPLENGLEAKEEKIRFKGELKQEIKSRSPSMTVDFTGSVDQMIQEWDVDEIGFDLYVTYTDIVGQEHSTHISSCKDVRVENGMVLSDALDQGEDIDQPLLNLVPDSAKTKVEKYFDEATSA